MSVRPTSSSPSSATPVRETTVTASIRRSWAWKGLRSSPWRTPTRRADDGAGAVRRPAGGRVRRYAGGAVERPGRAAGGVRRARRTDRRRHHRAAACQLRLLRAAPRLPGRRAGDRPCSRRAGDLRRGDHRLPAGAGRRPRILRPDAGPVGVRQGDRRRLPTGRHRRQRGGVRAPVGRAHRALRLQQRLTGRRRRRPGDAGGALAARHLRRHAHPRSRHPRPPGAGGAPPRRRAGHLRRRQRVQRPLRPARAAALLRRHSGRRRYRLRPLPGGPAGRGHLPAARRPLVYVGATHTGRELQSTLPAVTAALHQIA